MLFISAACPYRCTGIMAFVLEFILSTMLPGSILKVFSLMSAKTGLAPVNSTELEVATNEKGVVMTSSPCPISWARSATCSAAVPEFTATACDVPVNSANAASKRFTLSPSAMLPDLRTSATAFISSSPIRGFAIGIIFSDHIQYSQFFIQFFYSCRKTCSQLPGRYVSRHERTCCHHRAFAYLNARQYGGVCADRCTSAQYGTFEVGFFPYWIFIVREHSARTDEHIIFNYHIERNIYVPLDADIASDLRVPVYDGIGADQHFISKPCFFPHHDIMSCPQVVSDHHVCIDRGVRPDDRIIPDSSSCEVHVLNIYSRCRGFPQNISSRVAYDHTFAN